MHDITDEFLLYREWARHLWNSGFRPKALSSQDWDLQEAFEEAARQLFWSIVARPLGMTFAQASLSPLPGVDVVPMHEQGVPILINRDLPRSGYWDHPVNCIRPGEMELQFVGFFDWDMLGFRDFRYYEVTIGASPTDADVVGRSALIECAAVRVLYGKPMI